MPCYAGQRRVRRARGLGGAHGIAARRAARRCDVTRRRLGRQRRAARWCTWGAGRAGPGVVREQGRRRERRGRGASGRWHGGRCGHAVRGERRHGSRGVRARGACPSVRRRPGVRAGREQGRRTGGRAGTRGRRRREVRCRGSGHWARRAASARACAHTPEWLGAAWCSAREGRAREGEYGARWRGWSAREERRSGARAGERSKGGRRKKRGEGKKRKEKKGKWKKGKIKRKGGEREKKKREGGIRAAISAPGRPRAGSGTRARSGASRGSRANRERAGVRNRTLGT